MLAFFFLALVLVVFLARRFGPRLSQWGQGLPLFPLHTVSIYAKNFGMAVEFVIGGKTCARMGKDAFLVLESGESFSLDIDEKEPKVSLIGISQDNLPRYMAVRDLASGELTIIIENQEFKIPRSLHNWFINFGSSILLDEERIGTFWAKKKIDHVYLEFFTDLPEREMVLLAVLASEAP
ncbi:hypothetical protein GS624_03545 [Ruegeria sp. HKCCD5849]|uniref:hypothetical protein n=1 Tax=unclassified Ruegeria TaxID=2625375 RepID=UPI0014917C0C|nr:MULTISPECIES: hypothetical protein [unclassified Ruegeria]NOD46378.1 hypothetical protein [Ruegeria sp. HKCCD5849]NOD50322.1 hypothetical protein [Ruegeria sp. HKCCD5851]